MKVYVRTGRLLNIICIGALIYKNNINHDYEVNFQFRWHDYISIIIHISYRASWLF